MLQPSNAHSASAAKNSCSLPFLFPCTKRQRRLTFFELIRPSEPGLSPFFQGDAVISMAMAPSHEALPPPWRESIVLDIPSGLSSARRYFITSTITWPAFRSFSLNLTSHLGTFYHPSRWEKGKSAHERSLGHGNRKPISYLLFVLVNFAIFLNTVMAQPIKSLFGLGFICLGIPAYDYWKRKSA